MALPSDMLLTKAWLAPLSALAGVAAFDRGALRRFRRLRDEDVGDEQPVERSGGIGHRARP